MSYRAGFVGLIGLPNSGKSTLLNALVGEKVSIVTPKPQTTRRRVMGLVCTPKMQAVVVDAPGLVKPRAGLNRFLREEAMDVIGQSDALAAVLNIDQPEIESLEEVISLARGSGKPWLAVINKTDLPLPHRTQILRGLLGGSSVPVLQGSALVSATALREDWLARVEALLPEAPGPLYDEDLYTLSPLRELCSEIVRERCFEHLHQEIPFGLAVRPRSFDETGDVVRVEADILVTKENHRPIVIGRGGRVLKQIGTEARLEMEKTIGRRVHLLLNVSAKRNWAKNPAMMKDLGYVVET